MTSVPTWIAALVILALPAAGLLGYLLAGRNASTTKTTPTTITTSEPSSNGAKDFANCQTVGGDWIATPAALITASNDPAAAAADTQQLSQDLQTLELQATVAGSHDVEAFLNAAELFKSER